MKDRETFEQWKNDVDACLEKLIGIDSEGLPDWRYHDAYDEGMTPYAAAKSVIRAAMDF